MSLWVNGALRPAQLLTNIGHEVLVEYRSKRNTRMIRTDISDGRAEVTADVRVDDTYLRIVDMATTYDPDVLNHQHDYRSMSYERLPLRWLIKLATEGVEWWAEDRTGLTPGCHLSERIGRTSTPYFMHGEGAGMGGESRSYYVIKHAGEYWSLCSNWDGWRQLGEPCDSLEEALDGHEEMLWVQGWGQEVECSELSIEQLLPRLVAQDPLMICVNGVECEADGDGVFRRKEGELELDV